MNQYRRIDLHDERSIAYAGNRGRVADEIVGELVVKHVGDTVSGDYQKERIAVGGRPRDCLGGDLPLGARSVLDDEWLAETRRQPLTNQAREDVGRATGRKAYQDVYRPRRIGLRPSHLRHRRQRGSTRGQMQKISAGKFHFEPPFRWRATEPDKFDIFWEKVVPYCFRRSIG